MKSEINILHTNGEKLIKILVLKKYKYFSIYKDNNNNLCLEFIVI